MKLPALLLGTLLGTLVTVGTAAADDMLRPPGGPVYAGDAQPMPPGPDGPGAWGGPGAVRRGPGAMQPGGPQQAQRQAQRQQLRRAFVEAFDANGDGRLGPRERMRAIRVLRRMERRLARAGGPGGGGPGGPGMAGPGPDPGGRAVRGAIRRYDLNRDGNVGPDEMPPAAANRLRRLDRDGDGWVEPGEYR